METALVTGTSRGIGRAIAEAFASRGFRVIGIARSVTQPLQGVEQLACDLADSAQLDRTLSEICAAEQIDVIVNNAGASRPADLEDVRDADLDYMFAVNVRAAVQCTRAVVPGMRARRYGRIINIGSRAALGKPARTGYGASKAAVTGLTRTWALELAPAGITANCIAPGPINTELFSATNPPGSPGYDSTLDEIPVGRLGRPEDVAAAALFLGSKEAGFITGQVLYVCGGISVGYAPG